MIKLDFFSDGFGWIFDTLFGIFKTEFQSPVFQYFLDSDFYTNLGLIFILTPLIMFVLFYYGWRYPYGKWWHWLIWYIIILIIVYGGTFFYAREFILSSNSQEMIACYDVEQCAKYIKNLHFEYAKANTICSAVVGFLGSLVLKQFSKVQTHLPF